MELMNARDIYKHLKTEPSQNDYAYPQLDKRKIVEAQEGNIRQNPKKKSILQNPTFLSSVFFA